MDAAGKLGGRTRLPFFSWENYRLLFDTAFWLTLGFTYVGYAVVLVDSGVPEGYDPRLFGLLPVTLAFAAVGVTWQLLPWRPGGGQRFLVVPLFVASVFWLNYAMVAVDRPFYWPLFLLMFAHGVFAFGIRWSLGYAALILGLILGFLLLTDDAGLLGHVVSLVLISPSVLFVIAASAAVLEATRRRAQAQDLLEELEAAHAELRAYAGKVRELSVSEERTRMAREIHDSVGHYLTVVNVQLEAAGKLMDRKPERAREEVDKAKGLASEALSEVRRSVRALRPLTVEERSGMGAMYALVRSLEGMVPAVSFEIAGEERELPPEVELVLYRSLQEGLTNALRYSKARHVRSLVRFGTESVGLSVTDDGEGAPEEAVEGGFGLSALRGRVEALGGSFGAGNVPGGVSR